MTLHQDTIQAGESLPCHQSNIIHTEDVSDALKNAFALRIWWVESEGGKE